MIEDLDGGGQRSGQRARVGVEETRGRPVVGPPVVDHGDPRRDAQRVAVEVEADVVGMRRRAGGTAHGREHLADELVVPDGGLIVAVGVLELDVPHENAGAHGEVGGPDPRLQVVQPHLGAVVGGLAARHRARDEHRQEQAGRAAYGSTFHSLAPRVVGKAPEPVGVT